MSIPNTVHRLILALGLLVALVVVGGCASPYVRMPNFFHPGPAGYQRYGALFHDPYPQTDVAPEIVGGRPLSFQKPIPEAVRNQPIAPPRIRSGYPWR